MNGSARAVTHPNLALAKYWGKLERDGNFPAVPSLSVALGGLVTTTRVRFDPSLGADRLVLNGEEASGTELLRAVKLMDRVRAARGMTQRPGGAGAPPTFAEISSDNDFPTASGIASSASGFAALALAATRAAGLDWDAPRVSSLARESSASAARSVFGGFVELEAGAEAARQVTPPEHLDLSVLVCVAGEGKKKDVGSTDGMRRTAAQSPYHAAWLELAPRRFAELRAALLAKDFEKLGELAEASSLAMHASAIAAGVVYFGQVSLDGLQAVRQLRAKGTPAYASMDAGPHVKVLTRRADAAFVGTWLRAIPGVSRVIEAHPGAAPTVGEERS
jgi:diphosphomevalonate decarboxylase